MTKKGTDKFSPADMAVISESFNRASEYADKKIKEKFNNVSWLMVGVVIVVFIGFVQLIVDSFHINSATYNEYSQKTETLNQIQKTNQELLNQSIQNQKIIIETQNTIKNIQLKQNGITP
jgi:hypothetical protein